MQEERIKYLFQLHLSKACTPAEREELAALALQEQHVPLVKELISNAWNTTGEEHDLSTEKTNELFTRIIAQKEEAAGTESLVVSIKPRIQLWKRIAIAASVIGIIFLTYFITTREKVVNGPSSVVQGDRFRSDAAPGTSKATLTLSDGSIIILDSAGTGQLTTQGNTVITNSNGQLVYDHSPLTSHDSRILYNTLSTSRGETYTTVLADGSKVWLNSASTIKYPVAFNGKERRVEITGEAYFEVKHNEKMPFIVSVNGMEVHDLGTEFNINAYNDEADIKTTLVSGSARVIKGNANQLLIPGQQSAVARSDEGATKQSIKVQDNADVAEAIAWRNGIFKFSDAGIEQLMRQFARWYNVEIVYENKVTDHFIVTIPRTVTLVNALKILEETGTVRFKTEGRKIIVSKQ